jgi:hypothetical protein
MIQYWMASVSKEHTERGGRQIIQVCHGKKHHCKK